MNYKKTLFNIIVLGMVLSLYDVLLKPYYIEYLSTLGIVGFWSYSFGWISMIALAYFIAWFVTRRIE